MDQELQFYEVEGKGWPRAWCGDVSIKFIHYSTEMEARDSWERRKKRINWDNLYVIIYAREGIKESDYQRLKRCNFKNIAIVGNENPKHFVTDIVRLHEPTETLFTKVNGVRLFEKHFDYITFLKKRSS